MLDARSGTVLRRVPVGHNPMGIAVDERTGRAFVYNSDGPLPCTSVKMRQQTHTQPRYDAYLRPLEQATPRTARRRATTSPHGKMVPMDLIDEESGLCVMRHERKQGHDCTSTRHPVRDGGSVPGAGACDGRYERQRAEAGSPGRAVSRTPLTPSGGPLYADASG